MYLLVQGEFGHLVLLAVFDCVDDTKLVKQAVLSVSLGESRQQTAQLCC